MFGIANGCFVFTNRLVRKDTVRSETEDTKPRFCTYRVGKKTIMKRCNEGIHVKDRCIVKTEHNSNSSLKKSYVNNYRRYK